MQPVSRNPFRARARRALQKTDPDPARLREPPSADRDIPPSARDTCGACPAPPPHRPPRADRRFRSIQTGHSASRKLNTPPAVGRRCSARQAILYAGTGTKKTGRQPTLGPAKGTGYRDASSCRRPAICGKISAQITRRTGTARQPGQPVVQIYIAKISALTRPSAKNIPRLLYFAV